MSPEECAARMTAFLQHRPHRKTQQYLETLPKRTKVVVHSTEFIVAEPRRIGFTPEPIRGRIIAPFAVPERKDRLRPKKRKSLCRNPTTPRSKASPV